MGSQSPVRPASAADSGHAGQAGQALVISSPALGKAGSTRLQGEQRQTGPRLVLLVHGSVRFPSKPPSETWFPRTRLYGSWKLHNAEEEARVPGEEGLVSEPGLGQWTKATSCVIPAQDC